MELSDWFKGFEKGIARLSPEQRSAFFSECGKNCVDGGTLSIYRKLYEDAGGDMDVFFQLANGLPGVKGEVVEKGKVYYLTFLECTCHLCKKGYVTTPMLCECSRQSCPLLFAKPLERAGFSGETLPFHFARRTEL